MEFTPKLEVDPEKDQNMCFGCGKENPIGLKLKFTWDEKSRTASSQFTPGPNLQGWPGFIHGGISACVLDEAIGWASMFAGTNNVTARMQVRYRQMLPMNGTYNLTCTIIKQSSRLIETQAYITGMDGTVYAEATSTQFVVSQRKAVKRTVSPLAVIWDMDGVIVDSADLHRESWNYAFGRQGIKYTKAEFDQIFGQRNDFIIHKKMGPDVPQAKIEEISRDKEDFFRTELEKHPQAFPGVIKLLKVLKENGIKSAIASSAPLENVLVTLKGLKIEEYFQAIAYGQEVSESKPSPQVFLKAAEKLGVAPAECVVVEDAVVGVKAGKRAGMRCIAVTNSHPAKNLAEADLVVDSLEKVGLAELESLFKPAR